MKMIEAVIRPFKLDEVRSALTESGVTAMTVSEVFGAGPRSVRDDFYRGLEYTRLVPGFKLEVAVSDHLCDHIVRIITRGADGAAGLRHDLRLDARRRDQGSYRRVRRGGVMRPSRRR